MSEFRRRLMMAAEQGGSSVGHVQLEYLSTTGEQYVITDITVPASNTKVQTITEIKDTSTASVSRSILFTYNSSAAAHPYQLYANGIRFYLCSSIKNKNHTSFQTLEGLRTSDKKNYVIVSGSSSSQSAAPATDLANSIVILCGTYSGSLLSNNQSFKYIDLYFDDVLVANFIPVRVGSIAQFYDTINDKYWRSQTNVDFVAGPDKS